MPFERSLEIARRLDDVLRLISTGRYSTPMLAEEVGVSIPTISRIVAALRVRGHDIRAEKNSDGWRYVLVRNTTETKSRQEPGFFEVYTGHTSP
jgi:predicted DNA-binding transcriptional regulator YafY